MFYRHGDVDLRPVPKIPKDAHLIQTKTVAYGEVTGHHHTFSGQVLVYEPKQGETILVDGEQIPIQKYVEVQAPAKLEHQEHKTIQVEKGTYAILQEREWNPFDQQIRRVLD